MNITCTQDEKTTFTWVEKEETPIVTTFITVDTFTTGSLEDVAVAELYTDMIMSGAGAYSRTEFLDKINGLGASLAISTSEGTVTFTVETLLPKLEKVLHLVKLMFLEPHFSDSELARAKVTLQNSLSVYKEQARAMAYDAFARTIYPPEHRAFAHTPEDVSTILTTITTAHLKSFHHLVQNQPWLITVGGNTKAMNQVKKLCSQIQLAMKEKVIGKAKPATKISKNVLVTTAIPSQQNVEFSIGSSLRLTYSDKEMPALYFGLAVLGKWGGFAGRLMSTVREKEGLTYGIYARIENVSLHAPGHWRIMTFFAPKDTMRGITSTRREIDLIILKGITDSELRRFKDILKTSHVLLFDSLVLLTQTIHQNQVRGLNYEKFTEFHSELQLLTKREVNLALAKYLRPNELVFSAAGPVKNILPDLREATR